MFIYLQVACRPVIHRLIWNRFYLHSHFFLFFYEALSHEAPAWGKYDWMTWLIASVHAGPTVRELWFADISDRKFTRCFKCLRNRCQVFPLWRTHPIVAKTECLATCEWSLFQLEKCRQRKCHLKTLQFLWAQSRRLVEGKELKEKNARISWTAERNVIKEEIDGN